MGWREGRRGEGGGERDRKCEEDAEVAGENLDELHCVTTAQL